MDKKQESQPTQQFIEIQSIENGAVKLKSGALRKILMVSGINFELKSEEEQGIILYAFQTFLNSLDFSLQFFIHSRKLNIEGYLAKLEERQAVETNELLKNQIIEYQEFIRNFVSQNAIMEKNFFVVVPYDFIQIPAGGAGLIEKAKELLGRKSAVQKVQKEDGESANLEQLDLRADQVIGGLNQIGLRAVPLEDEELKELFYNLYNPETTEKIIKDIK